MRLGETEHIRIEMRRGQGGMMSKPQGIHRVVGERKDEEQRSKSDGVGAETRNRMMAYCMVQGMMPMHGHADMVLPTTAFYGERLET